MGMACQNGFLERIRAAGIHLLLSSMIAILASVLVFELWFPGEYKIWASGRELFLILMGVDLILGPLLTFVVFDLSKKNWAHLRWDLGFICLLQLSALGYGMWTVYNARPVAMVFEKDRFRIITIGQVNIVELNSALPAYRRLPMAGPWLLGTRRPTDEERLSVLMLSIEGVDVAQRPLFWQPYEASLSEVLMKARPLAQLLKHYPAQAERIHSDLKKLGVDEEGACFLPLIARSGDWIAILDAAGQPVHFLPIDGFF